MPVLKQGVQSTEEWLSETASSQLRRHCFYPASISTASGMSGGPGNGLPGSDSSSSTILYVPLPFSFHLSTINWWDSLDTDIGGHIRLTVGLSGEFVSTSTLMSPHARTSIRVRLIFGHHTILDGHASGAESAAEGGLILARGASKSLVLLW